MYRIVVVCVLAVAVALPVLPDPPSLPGQLELKFDESTVDNNLPKVETINEVEHEEKKDENEAEESEGAIIKILPEPPLLPPLDEAILKDVINQQETTNSDKTENTKAPSKEGETTIKEEHNKGVQVEILEIKNEPVKLLSIDDGKWSIPKPPILNGILSSINKIPISLPSLSSLGFPIKLPSFFNRPVIRYPSFIEVEV